MVERWQGAWGGASGVAAPQSGPGLGSSQSQLLREPESLLMLLDLLPPPFLAVDSRPNPISATFDTQQSPSLLPPLSLFLSLDTLIHFSDNQCP